MDNDFMAYMSYRDTLIEEKVNECLCKIKSGKNNVTVSRNDLTDEELEQVRKEVIRRLNNS